MSMLIIDLDTYYEDIEKALGDLKDETPKVLRSALSNTARRVRRQVVKEAAKRYDYQDDGVWKASNAGAIKLKAKTKGDAFYTRLVSSGPMNELMDFMVTPSAYNPDQRPDVHKSKVLSTGALKVLGEKPKPFVTRFRSGRPHIPYRSHPRKCQRGKNAVVSPREY